MSEFVSQISGVGSNCSTNVATNTVQSTKRLTKNSVKSPGLSQVGDEQMQVWSA